MRLVKGRGERVEEGGSCKGRAVKWAKRREVKGRVVKGMGR